MVTPGSPSPKGSSRCPSQRHHAVNAVPCDCGGCGASFSTGLFLEENVLINLFLSFLAVAPTTLQLRACWDGSQVVWGHGRWWYQQQMLVLVAEAGTHRPGQVWNTQLLSTHQQVKHLCRAPLLKMHGLWHYTKEIDAFLFDYGKCILLLWVDPLRL